MTIQRLHELAKEGALPCHKYAGVLCPSGMIVMDWNSAVRGSWRFALWAKAQNPPRADIIDKERKDLEFLASQAIAARQVMEKRIEEDERKGKYATTKREGLPGGDGAPGAVGSRTEGKSGNRKTPITPGRNGVSPNTPADSTGSLF